VDYTLKYVRVFVTDWSRAVDFYAQTLQMIPVFVTDGWAEFATGEAHLALERVDPADPESEELVGRFVGVSLRVADVVELYEDLASRGVEFLAPPEQQPWGGTLAHLRDPDGNILTLLSG
jgi:lactoylglutathione lyase